MISKFSSTLGGLDAIDSPEILASELKKDELLKRDVYSLVESVFPYLPMIGFLSGGVTVGRHICNDKSKTKIHENEEKSE